jgi:hypothetical protein
MCHHLTNSVDRNSIKFNLSSSFISGLIIWFLVDSFNKFKGKNPNELGAIQIIHDTFSALSGPPTPPM